MKLFTSIKRFTKKLVSKKVIVAAAVVLGLGASYGAVQAEFYPDRQPFDYNVACDPTDANIYDRCGSLDGPVFNSFINTPSYGDERAFADARRTDQTATGSYKNVLPDVTEGSQEVIIRTYVHNNANTSTNASGLGIAKDATVRIDLPEATGSSLRARSYIDASNAALVEDTVDLTAAGKFRVEYIPGSATLYNNGIYKNGVALSDSIVTTGALIGYDSLNGELPGCFDYEAIVHVRVKIIPVEEPKTELEKQVRLKGTTEWKQEVTAKPGDKVEWLLTTEVTGGQQLNNIVIRDVPAPNTTLVGGSVKVIDASRDEVIADGPLFDGGFNFGNYAAGSGFYVLYESTIQGDFLGCEARVRNQAFVKSYQQASEIKDTADVIIVKENCEEPKQAVVCNSLTAGTLSLKTGDSTVFTADASATNATISSYKFSVNGEVVQNSASNTYTFTQGSAGKYIVSVVIISSIGEITSADCAKTVTVVDEDDPIYACNLFTLAMNNRKADVSFKATASNGAAFKDATIVYTADGSKVHEELTNKVGANGLVSSSYTFATGAKNVFAKASVRFNVTNQDGSSEVKVVSCQGKAVLGAKTPPKELPNTGAGSTIIVMMAAVAGAGSIAHRKRTLSQQ